MVIGLLAGCYNKEDILNTIPTNLQETYLVRI